MHDTGADFMIRKKQNKKMSQRSVHGSIHHSAQHLVWRLSVPPRGGARVGVEPGHLFVVAFGVGAIVVVIIVSPLRS